MATSSKVRLQICLFTHALLLVPVLIKMVADVCDALDVSPLHIDEYSIPKPVAWEYAWSFSVLFVVYGLVSLRNSRGSTARQLCVFIVGDVLFGVVPIAMALTEDHHDFHHGYHVDVQWYIFSVVALPVHFLSIFYAWKMIILGPLIPARWQQLLPTAYPQPPSGAYVSF